jgi:hypothetical protein
MKMMARICLRADNAELSVAALRTRGFEVLTHIFPSEPGHVFAEASRDVGEGDEHQLSGNLLDEVEHIVGRGGSVDDAGRIPVGHVPFEYETAAWRGAATD